MRGGRDADPDSPGWLKPSTSSHERVVSPPHRICSNNISGHRATDRTSISSQDDWDSSRNSGLPGEGGAGAAYPVRGEETLPDKDSAVGGGADSPPGAAAPKFWVSASLPTCQEDGGSPIPQQETSSQSDQRASATADDSSRNRGSTSGSIPRRSSGSDSTPDSRSSSSSSSSGDGMPNSSNSCTTSSQKSSCSSSTSSSFYPSLSGSSSSSGNRGTRRWSVNSTASRSSGKSTSRSGSRRQHDMRGGMSGGCSAERHPASNDSSFPAKQQQHPARKAGRLVLPPAGSAPQSTWPLCPNQEDVQQLLQRDEQQQMLVQGRLVDDTIVSKPSSFFSRVTLGARGAPAARKPLFEDDACELPNRGSSSPGRGSAAGLSPGSAGSSSTGLLAGLRAFASMGGGGGGGSCAAAAKEGTRRGSSSSGNTSLTHSLTLGGSSSSSAQGTPCTRSISEPQGRTDSAAAAAATVATDTSDSSSSSSAFSFFPSLPQYFHGLTSAAAPGFSSVSSSSSGQQLPRSGEAGAIENGEMCMQTCGPEQAADIAKALLLHQQRFCQHQQLERMPLASHPLSPHWQAADVHSSTPSYRVAAPGSPTAGPTEEERGTQTFRIVREVYEASSSSATARSQGDAVSHKRDPAAAQESDSDAEDAVSSVVGERVSRERRTAGGEGRRISREGLIEDEEGGGEGGDGGGGGEAAAVALAQQEEGRAAAEATGGGREGRKRTTAAAGAESANATTRAAAAAMRPQQQQQQRRTTQRQSEMQQNKLEQEERQQHEQEEKRAAKEECEEEEEDVERSKMLQELEARLKEDAEDYLESARCDLESCRMQAEREVLALQYIPFKADRLLSLSVSCRESILGLFVCLCLQHIDSVSTQVQGLVSEWSLIFLHTLASPQVLHVDANVEKSLVRPIVLRERLAKDGVKAADIVSTVPLSKAVLSACDDMQPEVDSIFKTIQAEMSCFSQEQQQQQQLEQQQQQEQQPHEEEDKADRGAFHLALAASVGGAGAAAAGREQQQEWLRRGQRCGDAAACCGSSGHAQSRQGGRRPSASLSDSGEGEEDAGTAAAATNAGRRGTAAARATSRGGATERRSRGAAGGGGPSEIVGTGYISGGGNGLQGKEGIAAQQEVQQQQKYALHAGQGEEQPGGGLLQGQEWRNEETSACGRQMSGSSRISSSSSKSCNASSSNKAKKEEKAGEGIWAVGSWLLPAAAKSTYLEDREERVSERIKRRLDSERRKAEELRCTATENAAAAVDPPPFLRQKQQHRQEGEQQQRRQQEQQHGLHTERDRRERSVEDRREEAGGGTEEEEQNDRASNGSARGVRTRESAGCQETATGRQSSSRMRDRAAADSETAGAAATQLPAERRSSAKREDCVTGKGNAAAEAAEERFSRSSETAAAERRPAQLPSSEQASHHRNGKEVRGRGRRSSTGSPHSSSSSRNGSSVEDSSSSRGTEDSNTSSTRRERDSSRRKEAEKRGSSNGGAKGNGSPVEKDGGNCGHRRETEEHVHFKHAPAHPLLPEEREGTTFGSSSSRAIQRQPQHLTAVVLREGPSRGKRSGSESDGGLLLDAIGSCEERASARDSCSSSRSRSSSPSSSCCSNADRSRSGGSSNREKRTHSSSSNSSSSNNSSSNSRNSNSRSTNSRSTNSRSTNSRSRKSCSVKGGEEEGTLQLSSACGEGAGKFDPTRSSCYSSSSPRVCLSGDASARAPYVTTAGTAAESRENVAHVARAARGRGAAAEGKDEEAEEEHDAAVWRRTAAAGEEEGAAMAHGEEREAATAEGGKRQSATDAGRGSAAAEGRGSRTRERVRRAAAPTGREGREEAAAAASGEDRAAGPAGTAAAAEEEGSDAACGERRGRTAEEEEGNADEVVSAESLMLPSRPPSARAVLLRELTTALVTIGSFDSRVQLLLHVFAVEMLRLNPLVLVRLEHYLAADLLDLLKASTKEGARQKAWRRLKIAGAAIGGGLLVALTAGIAAPGIAAGIASLGFGGASLSAFLASAGGMAAIVSLFGAGGAGLTGWKYSRRIANIKVFAFDMLNGKTPASLRVTVCVSGYLRTYDDISLPWIQALPHACSDLHSLRWEPTVLKALGNMVVQMLSQDFAVAAGKYYLQHTALGGLTVALFWPMALIQYAATLDNTWVLCRERAQQAGKLLADAISDTQAVGQRPVTLVGYSMGARVVFYCLQALWKRRKLHVVCDCVLMGLPASLNVKQWTAARDVVSGRLVNVYTRSDWLLAFLYRWMEWGLQVAGLSPVQGVKGVENYDVTGLVKSHAQYPEKIPDILSFIGFDA